MTHKGLYLTLFWIVVAVLLLKQAFDYNKSVDDQAAARKNQKTHFFYDLPHHDSGAFSSDTGIKAAKVIQQSYFVTSDNVSRMFTCHSVVKNIGNAKAQGIELKIRPYFGTVSTRERGDQPKGVLSDADPMSQINVMVEVPDLAPGESATETADFPIRPEINPGANPNPEIIFRTEKAP